MLGLVLAAVVTTCGNSATQMQLDVCAAQRLHRADAAERRAYAAVRRQSADPRSLRSAEQRWRAARAAACAFDDAMVAGGSLLPMIDAECRAASAEVRARTLRRFTGRADARDTVLALHVAAEHDRVYGLLELLVSPHDRALLAASERAWLAYRRAACPDAHDLCAIDLTRERTRELKASWLADPFW